MNIDEDKLITVLQSAGVLTSALFVPDSVTSTAFLCGKHKLGLELLDALGDEQKQIILSRLICPKQP